MPRRRSEYKRLPPRGYGGNVRSYFPWLIGIFVVVSALTTLFLLRPIPIDSVTNCPKNDSDYGVTAVIIDISDELKIDQRASLESQLENLGTAGDGRSPYLNKGDRLVVYFMEEEGVKPNKVFDFCNPGKVSERTLSESLSEGEVFARKRWINFSTNMLKAIDQHISASAEKQTSPILETINYVRAEKSFPPPGFLLSKRTYRILLWSDMIQHSSIESHFNGHGNIREVYKQNPMNLNGIKVTLFHLSSKKYSSLQTNEHFTWWRRMFFQSGAQLEQPETL